MAWAEKYDAEKALKLKGSYTKADVMAAYRTYVKTSHPDIGGDHDEMIAVNKAKGFMDRLFKDEPEDCVFTCEAEREKKKEEKKTASEKKSAPKKNAAPVKNPTEKVEEEAWWRESAKVDAPVDPAWDAAWDKYCSEFNTASSNTPKPEPEPDPVQTSPSDNPQSHQEAHFDSSDSFWSYSVDDFYNDHIDAFDSKRGKKDSPIYRFANFMVDGFPWKVLFAIACLAYALFYPLDLDDYANCWMHVLSVVALIINCASGIFTGILSLPFRLLRMVFRG